jgi:hypothetical protein
MPWLAILKRAAKGLPVVILVLAALFFVRWVAGLASDRATLQAEVGALEAQNELLRRNAEVCAECETKAAECLERLDQADRLAADWQARYDARPVHRVVVEVPADLVPPDASCDEAVTVAADWLASNPPPWGSP